MLDVHRLRALFAVREHGGLVPAARALAVPPDEVAGQVDALERQLGVTLLAGEPRGSRLTQAGQRLATHAHRVLAGLEAAEAELSGMTGRAAGLLRVAATPAAARALLPDTLSRLRETAPEVDVRVEQLDPDESLAGLVSGTVDVAVIGEYGLVPRRLDSTLERRDLLVEPVLVAVPARHPVLGPTVRLVEVAGDRWVGGAPGSPALEALRRGVGLAGAEPRVVAECADDALALALVAAGVGLALVPASAADRHGGTGRRLDGVRLLTPGEPGLRRTVAAVVRRSAAGGPALGRLLDALALSAQRFVDMTPGAVSRAVAAPAAPERNGHAPVLPPVPSAEPRPRRAPRVPVPPPAANGEQRREAPPRADQVSPGGALLDPRRGSDLLGPADPPGRPGGPRRPRLGELPRRPSPDLPEIGPPLPEASARRPAADPGPMFRASTVEPPASSDLGARSLPPADSPTPRLPGTGTTTDPAGARRPGAPAGQHPETPRRAPADSRAEHPAGHAGRGTDALDAPLDTLPTAPDDGVRLSIFEELRSEWFSDGPGGAAGSAPWDSPADDGWKAAAKLAAPTTAGTTPAGLPRRVPQALLVPGAIGTGGPGDAPRPNGAANRSAQDVRGRLSSYRDGVRRGRHAERPHDDPDR